ncbi:hypothetical protein ACFSQ7_45550 [Paenibacillus rhizoplanae]
MPVEGMLRLLAADGSGSAPVTSASGQEISRMKPVYHSGKEAERVRVDGRLYAFVSVPVIWTDGNVLNLQMTKKPGEHDGYVAGPAAGPGRGYACGAASAAALQPSVVGPDYAAHCPNDGDHAGDSAQREISQASTGSTLEG